MRPLHGGHIENDDWIQMEISIYWSGDLYGNIFNRSPNSIDYFLMLDTWLRVSLASIVIFPLAFFFDTPFPLEILAISNKKGEVVVASLGGELSTVCLPSSGLAVVSMFARFPASRWFSGASVCLCSVHVLSYT